LAGIHRGDRALAARAFGAGVSRYTPTAGDFEYYPGRRISTPPAWTLESFRPWVEEVATNPADSIAQRVAGCGAMLLGALFCP